MRDTKRTPKIGLWAGAAVAALATLATIADAQTQPVSSAAISIEAQDLDSALRALAHQTGVQIVFSPALVRNHRAAAVTDAQSAEQALRYLLRNSGLTYRSTGRNTYTILAQADRQQASARGGANIELSDIIVTAQRREENMQDVPIAVAAVTAEALEESGLSATRDLPQIIPSVQMTRSGPSGLFFIRGVGTTNAATGEEGSNAMYVDGVYLGDLGQVINYFNNIERVELLRGPQGTLFGRNATGGLLHVVTRNPSDEFEASGQIGIANYETLSSQLYIGGPITERLSADFAWTSADQGEGWGRNRTLNTENQISEYWGVRAKVLWTPNAAWRFTLSGDYFENEDNLGLAWRIADGTVGTGGAISPGGHDNTANMPSLTVQEIWGVSLTTDVDLGFATLTSITAARGNTTNSDFDVDGGPNNLVNIDLTSNGQTMQQELRLASNGRDLLSWQIGAFYLRSKAKNRQRQFGGAFATQSLLENNILSTQDTDSYALFGEATYAITPSTDIIAGARYTEDQRAFDGNQTPTSLLGVIGPTTNVLRDLSYNEITYRLALRHAFSDDVNAYASFNHGFKAGLFSLQSPTTAPVNPQFIDAYEIGLKTELFDRRLRLNMAAYRYEIEDYQIRSAAVSNPAASVLLNAATVVVDGFDIEFQALLTDNLTLFGAATLLNSRFDQFGGPGAAIQAPIVYPRPASCTAPNTDDPGTLGPGPRTGGYLTCLGDVSGNTTPLAPDFTASIGANYTLPIGQASELRFSALYSYNSGYVFEPDNVAQQDAFSLLNGSVEYRFNGHLGIELWGRNLTGEDYAVQKITTATGMTEVLAAPLTYGVNLRFTY